MNLHTFQLRISFIKLKNAQDFKYTLTLLHLLIGIRKAAEHNQPSAQWCSYLKLSRKTCRNIHSTSKDGLICGRRRRMKSDVEETNLKTRRISRTKPSMKGSGRMVSRSSTSAVLEYVIRVKWIFTSRRGKLHKLSDWRFLALTTVVCQHTWSVDVRLSHMYAKGVLKSICMLFWYAIADDGEYVTI